MFIKNSSTIFGHKLFLICTSAWQVFCKFRPCIVSDAFLCTDASNENVLYVTLRALSCNLSILLFKVLLGNIPVSGQ